MASKRIGELSPNYGKKFSDEHRKKLSDAKKGKYVGELSPCYGKKGNEAARSIAIVQLTLNGDYIKKHDSMGLASEETGISSSAISKVCRGVRNHTGGYKWAKLLDYEEHLYTGIELSTSIKKIFHPKEVYLKILFIHQKLQK